MGLPRAIEAHKQGDLAEAMRHYQRAFDQGDNRQPLFQNYGALLRQDGKNDQALVVYERGILCNPNDIGVLTNRANLIREDKPASAMADLAKALRLRIANGDKPQDWNDLLRSLISLCGELGLVLGKCHWSVRTDLLGPEPRLLGQILIMLDGMAANDDLSVDASVDELRENLVEMSAENSTL